MTTQLGRKESLIYGREATEIPLFSPSVYLRLKSSNGYLETLEHLFSSRYVVEEKEPILNVETGAIYKSNLEGSTRYIVESSEWPDELKLLYDESKIKKAVQLEGKFARGITQTGYYHILQKSFHRFFICLILDQFFCKAGEVIHLLRKYSKY